MVWYSETVATAEARGSKEVKGGEVQGGEASSRQTMDNFGYPSDVAPFIQVVGPNFTVPDHPAGVFRVLFMPELLQGIVTETNFFASQCLYLPKNNPYRGRQVLKSRRLLLASPSSWAL